MESPVEIKEPILVKNPLTGRFVNVAPLLVAMTEFDGPATATSLQQAISRAIRHVNLAPLVDEETGSIRMSVNYDLYRLEDMFAAMSEYNQGK